MLKRYIQIAYELKPTLTQRQIAGRVDDMFAGQKKLVPLPLSWKHFGCTTLVEAFDNKTTQGRVKKYISDVTRVTKDSA